MGSDHMSSEKACAWCGRSIRESGVGRPRDYCRRSCRQRAYKDRRTQERIALALAEDRRRDIVRKTRNGLEAARVRGRVGGRPTVVDEDKRAAILARRERGQSIREIAAGVGVSVGVVHKTLKAETAEVTR